VAPLSPDHDRGDEATVARLATREHLNEARQHDLGNDGIVDAPLLRAGLLVVAAILRHDEVEIRKYVQPLTAPADAAHPAFPVLKRTGGGRTKVPVIAIAASIRDRDRGGQFQVLMSLRLLLTRTFTITLENPAGQPLYVSASGNEST